MCFICKQSVSFKKKTMSELLKCGSIIEEEKSPEVKPTISFHKFLSKKCLILDLRYVYKDKIKFEDWKCFEHYLEGKKGTCLNLI